MILMIDNYDSFTHMIVHYLQALGGVVHTIRNDELSVQQAVALNPSAVVISPGPCTPKESGISAGVVDAVAGVVPILGVCLGHQVIADYYGASVVKAPEIFHGRTSRVHHTGESVFASLPTPFNVMRYHSLVVDPVTLPSELKITAWTQPSADDSGVIMGLRHRTLPVHGVQFHPESILTEHGRELLGNFLNETLLFHQNSLEVEKN